MYDVHAIRVLWTGGIIHFMSFEENNMLEVSQFCKPFNLGEKNGNDVRNLSMHNYLNMLIWSVDTCIHVTIMEKDCVKYSKRIVHKMYIPSLSVVKVEEGAFNFPQLWWDSYQTKLSYAVSMVGFSHGLTFLFCFLPQKRGFCCFQSPAAESWLGDSTPGKPSTRSTHPMAPWRRYNICRV